MMARDVYGVGQNEYVTWIKRDKHAQAYKVLYSEKSATIARNMGIEKKAYETGRCLVCHTVYDRDVGGQALYASEGVSCEACHGPAGGWIAEHVELGWSHQKSLAAGMTDLRDLEVRAKVCLGCHLGDADKTVDHELIAAGHPNLSFELDNYTAALPPHWKEKRADRSGNVRIWAMGQAVAFREGLLQLARRTQSGQWPEFAEMNCYECHHTLRPNSWRRGRVDDGKGLGLPRWNAARFAMLRHLLSILVPDRYDALSDETRKLGRYIANIDASPRLVAESASKLAAAMDGVVQRIATAPLDGLPKNLVERISADALYLVNADVEAVEQAVMSINTLALAGELSTPATTELIGKLYDDVEVPERFDPERFKKHMKELRDRMAQP